jgi:hypothetical protein
LTLILEHGLWESQALEAAGALVSKYKEKTRAGFEVEETTLADRKWLLLKQAGEEKIFVTGEGALIFAGNQRAAVEECMLAAKSSEKSILSDPALSGEIAGSKKEGAKAFGYLTRKGMEGLADILSVYWAIEADEDETSRSLTAALLPNLIKNTIVSVDWNLYQKENGVEDVFSFKTEEKFAAAIAQTVLAGPAEAKIADDLPELKGVDSATEYNLKDPQLAWRGLTLSLASQTEDRIKAALLQGAAGQLLAPYGIRDPELFLASVKGRILLLRFDEEGDETAVIAEVKDKENLTRSLAGAKTNGNALADGKVFELEDTQTTAVFVRERVAVGERDNVVKLNEALAALPEGQSLRIFPVNSEAGKDEVGAVAVTANYDRSAAKIARWFSKTEEINQADDSPPQSVVFTKTIITPTGFQRRSISAYGFTGTLLEMALEGATQR